MRPVTLVHVIPAGEPAAQPVDAQEVVLLQAVRAFPSVSVLMTTTPGPAMTVTDHTRLQDLIDQIPGQLRKLDTSATRIIVTALNRLADRVAAEPVDQAIGLFVGPRTQRALRIGVPVLDRAVVEQTFVTRDLVRALQRTPRHLVLVFTDREARLFESVNGALRPATGTAFPYAAPRTRRPRRTTADRPRLEQADSAAFLREVDRRLAPYRAVHPSPLVLVGPESLLTGFVNTGRHLHRLAGTVPGHHIDIPLDRLAALTRPVVQRYLASREREALELVARRTAQDRVAAGMQQAWSASRTQPVEMLAVEEDLFYPARISPDGHTLSPDGDLGDPEVISDAVDELIEHVLIRGGWVALVGPRELDGHDGVALTVHPFPR